MRRSVSTTFCHLYTANLAAPAVADGGAFVSPSEERGKVKAHSQPAMHIVSATSARADAPPVSPTSLGSPPSDRGLSSPSDNDSPLRTQSSAFASAPLWCDHEDMLSPPLPMSYTTSAPATLRDVAPATRSSQSIVPRLNIRLHTDTSLTDLVSPEQPVWSTVNSHGTPGTAAVAGYFLGGRHTHAAHAQSHAHQRDESAEDDESVMLQLELQAQQQQMQRSMQQQQQQQQQEQQQQQQQLTAMFGMARLGLPQILESKVLDANVLAEMNGGNEQPAPLLSLTEDPAATAQSRYRRMESLTAHIEENKMAHATSAMEDSGSEDMNVQQAVAASHTFHVKTTVVEDADGEAFVA